MRKLGILLATFLIMLVACGPKVTEKELYTQAEQYYQSQKFEEAVVTYDQMINRFPQGEYASKAMFMAGYISANELKDLDKARSYYTRFLEKYTDVDPNLTASARWELEHLGETIDDIKIIQEDAQTGQKDKDHSGH